MYRLFYLIFSISLSQNNFNEHGQRHGQWIGYHENGQIKYQGSFINGDEVGLFYYYNYSGDKVIQLKYIEKGLKSEAILFYENGGVRSEGEYLNKEKIGLWTHYDIDGNKVAQENYLNNRLHGQCTYFHLNGLHSEVYNYENGVKNGVAFTFYKSGIMNTKCHYYDGLLNGLAQFYYNTKHLQIESSGYYKNGIKDSTWIFFDDAGDTLKLITYNNLN